MWVGTSPGWSSGIFTAQLSQCLKHKLHGEIRICWIREYIDTACLVVQWCPALCNPLACSPPGSSVHGIFQARILNALSISSSRVSARPRDRARISCVSCIVDRFFTSCAVRVAPYRHWMLPEYSLPGTSHWFHLPRTKSPRSLLAATLLRHISPSASYEVDFLATDPAFMLNTYCISAACFRRCSSPQRPFLDISVNTFIFPDRSACVCFLIAVGRHWWRRGKRVKCEAPVHTAACPPSSHQSGTSCLWEWMFSHANPTLDKHLIQPGCQAPCWNEIHIRTQGLRFHSCPGR